VERVHRFLAKQTKKKGWDFSDVPDARDADSVTHPLPTVIWSLLFGLVANLPTLRDVEEMTEKFGSWARGRVPKRISDTTLDTELRRLDPVALTRKLVLQVRDMYRSKMLKPFGLPVGVATIDGKNLATVDHDADGTAHERSSNNGKWDTTDGKRQGQSKEPQKAKPRDEKVAQQQVDDGGDEKAKAAPGASYWLMPALRATLTSAEAKPCIYQLPLQPGTGEATAVPAMVDCLHKAYGRSGMLEILDVDAGLTSLSNADTINDKYGYGYVMGVKGNQKELFEEAQALLFPMTTTQPCEAETEWERRGGKQIKRRLWRTFEMRNFTNSVGCWRHLRQTWLVRQYTRQPDGREEVEDRFFITSVLRNRLTPAEILLLVRRHWGVENDSFNSLDVQWREDHGPWCTQGQAVWALGLLRLMAYNMVQYLRKRRLRRRDADGQWRTPPRWRSVFEAVKDALKGHLRLRPETSAATIG